MASIKDVAAEAGVSVATVSRALNGHPSVSAAARARVLAAVETLGYRPNALARSLRTDQTRTLGLVISDVMNPYFTELARSVEEEARALGYSVIIGNADERPDLQDHHVTTLLDRRIDGLLVSPPTGAPRACWTPRGPGRRWSSSTGGSPAWTCPSSGRTGGRPYGISSRICTGSGTGGSRSSRGPPPRPPDASASTPSGRRSARTGFPCPTPTSARATSRPQRAPGHRGLPRPARAARGRLRRRQPDGPRRAGRRTGARAAGPRGRRARRVRRHPVVRAHRSAGHRDRPAHPRAGAGGRTRARRADRGAGRRVGDPSGPARRAPLVRRAALRTTPPSPSPVRRSTP